MTDGGSCHCACYADSAPRPQKLILAAKADRATRVLLIRDVEPQVLFYVCKNPRITLDAQDVCLVEPPLRQAI